MILNQLNTVTFFAKPLISIITVTLNSERYLENTIQSVIGQTYPLIEYIIVDGQSVDGTLNIIRKYAHRIHRWISEPDSGITEAMNKGIAMASGNFILFLHSDDYLFEKNSIEKAVSFMDENVDIFAFKVLLSHKNSTDELIPRSWNWFVNVKIPFCHQGVFCSTRLFNELGLFDTNFAIDADYDFLLRAYKKKYRAKTINYTLSTMRDTGISSRKDWHSLSSRFAEEKRVHYKNNHSFLGKTMYFLYWQLYLPYRRIKFFWENKSNPFS